MKIFLYQPWRKKQRELLVASTLSDDSLAGLRKCADECSQGYSWENSLVMHEIEHKNLGTLKRIVVLMNFRTLILDLAHKHAGHLGIAKMRQLLAPYHTWPGVHKNVRAHQLSCKECQKYKRNVPPLAPNQSMPILTEPFEKMAVDIVVPFPRFCLESKYPEVIPIKDMSAVTVTESLIDIFSCTGIPRLLLSDQGTQFMSSLVKALCDRLGVARITTSPYHPQSNGCLERLHGTLVPMMRKAISDKLTWPEQIKYALFALRGMPARDTGYSPYEIVFGRQFPSPLSLLFDTWSEKECKLEYLIRQV